MPPLPILIASFYRFVALPDYRNLQPVWRARAEQAGLKGTVLLAPEGINATLAGAPDAVRDFLAGRQQEDPRFADLQWLESWHDAIPFGRLRVRLKREIIRSKVDVDVALAGEYADAAQWEALLADPDTLLVDTRNAFEVECGTFRGAVNPGISDFSDLFSWCDTHLANEKHRKIAMFCTGGIRCEKSTAYLKQKGFPHVHHLKGGILKYLQDTGNRAGLWQGGCFVFDGRGVVTGRPQSVTMEGS